MSQPSNGLSPKPAPGGVWGFLLRLFGKLEIEEDERPAPKPARTPGPKTPAPQKISAAKTPPVAPAAVLPTAPPVGAGIEEFAKFAGLELKIAAAVSDAADAVPDEVKLE